MKFLYSDDPVNYHNQVKRIDIKGESATLTTEVITNNDAIEQGVNSGASVNELITNSIENDIKNETINEDSSLDKDVTNGKKVTTGNDNET